MLLDSLSSHSFNLMMMMMMMMMTMMMMMMMMMMMTMHCILPASGPSEGQPSSPSVEIEESALIVHYVFLCV